MRRLSPFRSYRDFVADQRDDADPLTFSRRYQEYKVSYAEELVRRYFERNADFEWFRERYDPSTIRALRLEEKERAKRERGKILEEIEEEGIEAWARRASLDPPDSPEAPIEDDSSAQKISSHKSTRVVLLAGIPASCSKKALEQAVEGSVLFKGRDGKSRDAWVAFEDDEAAENVEGKDNDLWLDIPVPPALAMAPLPWPCQEDDLKKRVLDRGLKMRARECTEKESVRIRRPRRALMADGSVDDFGRGTRPRQYSRPFPNPRLSEKARLRKDAEVAAELARALDKKRAVTPEDNSFYERIDTLSSATEKFDALAAYLRRVHLFLYYSGTQCTEVEMLTRDAPWLTRSDKVSSSDEEQKEDDVEEDWGPHLKEMDDKITDALNAALEDDDDDRDEDADKEDAALEETRTEFEREHTLQEEQGRARCAFDWCHKLFKSDAFLKKHLANRHSDYLEAWLTPTRRPFMWKLYQDDPNKPLPPVATEKGDEIDPMQIIREASNGQDAHIGSSRPHSRKRAPPHHSSSEADYDDQQRQHAPQGGGESANGGPSRKLTSYADVDAPKQSLLTLDYGVLLPPPTKKKRGAKKSAPPAPAPTETTTG